MCNSLDGSQTRRHQHSGNLFPSDTLLAHRQQLIAQLGQTRTAPQCQRQINVAKLARALEADTLQTHRHRYVPDTIVEQLRLLRSADQVLGLCLEPTVLVELA